jgi:hypothetical protein
MIVCTVLMVMVLVLSGVTSSGVAAEDTNWCLMLGDMAKGSGLFNYQALPALWCRLDADGAWSMPTVGDLAEDSSTVVLDDERAKALLAEVDMFSKSDYLGRAPRYSRNDAVVWTASATGWNETDASDWTLGPPPNGMHNYTRIYTDGVIVYFHTVGTPEFSSYAQWYMTQQDAVLWSITRDMNTLAATAFRSNWGFEQFPWPWELSDQVAIARYFALSGI